MTKEASQAAEKARLIEIIKTRSFSKGGEIKLASGRSSNFYFNMKPTMLDPEGAHLIGVLVCAALAGAQRRYGRRPRNGRGADRHRRRRHEPAQGLAAACILRAQAGEGSRYPEPRRRAPQGQTLAGRRVVIVEDVTTTGGSAMKAIAAVQAEGAIVDRVVTVVDRLEGAAETFKSAGIDFQAILTAKDFAD